MRVWAVRYQSEGRHEVGLVEKEELQMTKKNA
jgi:hypothetical protein